MQLIKPLPHHQIFAPENSITRQQMAVMIYNYAESQGIKFESIVEEITFSDSDQISDWAKKEVSEIQQAGLLYGKENNIFDPEGTATRAEFAAILQRFVDMLH